MSLAAAGLTIEPSSGKPPYLMQAGKRYMDSENDWDLENEDRDLDFRLRSPYPTGVLVAGIIWIVFGALIILNVLVMLVILGSHDSGENGARMAGGVCAGLFGVAFLVVGIQSVRGTARDTMGNAIGSILFSLLEFGLGLVYAFKEEYLQVVFTFFAGTGLMVAGILALVARDSYMAWRRDQRTRRRNKEDMDF